MFFDIQVLPGQLRRQSTIQHTATPLVREFCFLGERLRVQTNDVRVLAIAQDEFRSLPGDCQQTTTAAPLELRVVVRSAPARSTSAARPKPLFNTLGHLYYMNIGDDNTLLVDMHRGYALAFITPEMLADPALLRVAYFQAAVQVMLGMARDAVPVHAACVVRNGLGILLAAPSGVGKSTLTYACLRRGFGIVAEDVVHLKTCDPQLCAWGIPWKLHLLPDAPRFFPELAPLEQHLMVNGETKIAVDVPATFPGAARTSAVPGLLVLLQSGNGCGTSYAPISAAEAEAALPMIWSWEEGWKTDYDCALAALFTRPAYRLVVGGPPNEVAATLDDLVAHAQRTTGSDG